MTTTSPRQGWSPEEHARYLEAVRLFPNAPWRVIAAHVGTRTTRQTMTHAAKIALRQQRHARGLKTAGRRPRDRPSNGKKDSGAATAGQAERRREARRTLDRVQATVGTETTVQFEPRGGYVEMLRVAQGVMAVHEQHAMDLPAIDDLDWDEFMGTHAS